MSDIHTTAPGGQGGKKAPGSSWPHTLGISGMFCIIVAIGIGAVSKESAGLTPKVLALGGAALAVISGIWALIDWIFRKVGRGPQTTL